MEDTQLNVDMAHSEILKYFQSVSSNRWLMVKIFLVLIVFFIVFVVFFAWGAGGHLAKDERWRDCAGGEQFLLYVSYFLSLWFKENTTTNTQFCIC